MCPGDASLPFFEEATDEKQTKYPCKTEKPREQKPQRAYPAGRGMPPFVDRWHLHEMWLPPGGCRAD